MVMGWKSVGMALPSGCGVTAVPAAGSCRGVKYGTLGAPTLRLIDMMRVDCVDVKSRVSAFICWLGSVPDVSPNHSHGVYDDTSPRFVRAGPCKVLVESWEELQLECPSSVPRSPAVPE